MQQFHRFDLLRAWYAQYLQINNNSPRTITDYRFELSYFRRYLKAETTVDDLDGIDHTVLYGYSAWLYGRGLTARTIANKLGVLRSFFITLYDNHKIYRDLSQHLTLPRYGKRLPTNTLTENEIEQLIGYLQRSLQDHYHRSSPTLLRDLLSIELLYGTGIRRGELLNLRIGDFKTSDGLLVIRQGKGDKDRVVPVGEKCLSALELYCTYGRPRQANHYSGDYLLLNRWGGPLNVPGLQFRIRSVLTAAGIKKRIRIHDFRHTCATHMLNRGADIRYVQELLGHSCLSSTQVYTHVSIKKLQESHRKYHPREQEGFIDDVTIN